LQTIGFTGWRYDLVKGFHGKYVGEYNDATHPAFSVGEFYDGDRQKVTDWIDSTGAKSAAFDFPTRYLLYEACKSNDYSKLRSHNAGKIIPSGLIGYWSERAVTFVDNHDTEYRRDEEHHCHNDGTRHFPGKTVDMAYAYLLTHPGVPCVFWSHFFDWGEGTRRRIERLIHLRRKMGVWSKSAIEIKDASDGLYAAIIDGRVAMKLGARTWTPGGGWQTVMEEETFAVWKRG
jgi:alpha-amylase